MSTKAQMIKSETPRKFAVRHRNRRKLCGRPRAVDRKFGMAVYDREHLLHVMIPRLECDAGVQRHPQGFQFGDRLHAMGGRFDGATATGAGAGV